MRKSARVRRGARAWALQVLYAWEARRGAEQPRDVLSDFVRERRINEEKREYLGELVRIFDEHMPEIDHAVDGALTNWRLERLASIDRNVLRIAAAEMLYRPDVPPRVSIQEALALAESYGTNEAPRFVNGVLDALMRQIGDRTETAGEAR